MDSRLIWYIFFVIDHFCLLPLDPEVLLLWLFNFMCLCTAADIAGSYFSNYWAACNCFSALPTFGFCRVEKVKVSTSPSSHRKGSDFLGLAAVTKI